MLRLSSAGRLSILPAVAAAAFALVACAPGLPEDAADYELVEPASRPSRGASSGPEADEQGSLPAAADPEPADEGGPTCAVSPPSNACGLEPQCGCGPDETCAVTNATTGASACVKAGTAPLGHPCAGPSDCAQGLGCTRGACRPSCETSGTCTMPGTDRCLQQLNGDDPVPNSSVCSVPCNLRDPKECGANTCVRILGSTDVTDCRSPGPKRALEACAATSECGRGMLCIGQVCARWCRLGVAGDCGAGFTCSPMGSPPVIDGVEYGRCTN
jgi:hypothetical protein